MTEATLAVARAKALRGEGLLGQADSAGALAAQQRADANLKSAQAGAALATAAFKSAQSRLDKTKIFSPIPTAACSRASSSPGRR